jgi:hypothetical protein
VPEKHRDLNKTAAAVDAGARRAREIVASLRAEEPADAFDAFWELDALPADEVREALVPWVGPMPDLDRLDPARRLALGVPLRPLRLRTLSVARDADILDLGPIAEEQLQLAGKSWDGTDLPAEDRLDGEVEDSLAGTLERRVLVDAEAPGNPPLFDVLLFAEGAGVVFAAGTSKVVALIAYGKVELRDRRTRVAIEEAIASYSAAPASPELASPSASAASSTATVTAPAFDPPRAQTPSVAATDDAVATGTREKAVAKKASPKKRITESTAAKKAGATKGASEKIAAKTTAAKKAGAKKTGSKVAPTKKAVAKNAAVKKSAAKKAATKKPAAKKTTAKKTVAKKTVAKKATAKKVVTKKTVAKKAAAKKAAAKTVAKRGTVAAKSGARRAKA